MENPYQLKKIYSGTHAKSLKYRKLIVFQVIFVIIFIGAYALQGILKLKYPKLSAEPITAHPWLAITPFAIVISFLIIYYLKKNLFGQFQYKYLKTLSRLMMAKIQSK